MFFFIKPSVIHLDCFTQDARVHKYYPIAKSTNFYPEWWKNLPKTYKNEHRWFGNATMKTCPGFIDYYTNSISIPMWSDWIIDVLGKNQGYRWQFADSKTEVTHHDEQQFKNFIDTTDYAHIKIASPWRVKAKKSLKCVWTYPVWNYNIPDDILVLPAVINFRYTYGTDINILINMSRAKKIFINEGVPLVNLIPMTDKRIKIHNHLVSTTEYTKIAYVENLEARLFGRHRKNIKDIDRQDARCPFGFGKK